MKYFAELEIRQADGSIIVEELEANTQEELDAIVSDFEYESAFYSKTKED